MDDHWQPTVGRVPRLTTPVPCDPRGELGPTRGQAAGPRWRRTSRGLYVPACVSRDVVEQRILEAVAATHGRSLVTGWAALRLLGAAFFDGIAPDGRTVLPVPLLAADSRAASQPGIAVSRGSVPADEVVLRHGMRCVTPERALLEEIRRRGELREAITAIDMAAAGQVTSMRRFRAHLESRSGARGLALARRALDLANERSKSPQEVRFRLIWELDAGWGRPLVNRAVFDVEARFIGIPDLLDPYRGIAGEYDGADHRRRGRHARDVRREDLFRRAGLEYVKVVGPDVLDRRLVVDRLRAAEARAGRFPRRWRLGAPPAPLDDELDHRDAMIAMAEGGCSSE